MCRVKGQTLHKCHNYIRVVGVRSSDQLFVCGTNSYKPKCRHYRVTVSARVINSISASLLDFESSLFQNGQFEVKSEENGEGVCPYDPSDNNLAIFHGWFQFKTFKLMNFNSGQFTEDCQLSPDFFESILLNQVANDTRKNRPHPIQIHGFGGNFEFADISACVSNWFQIRFF